MYVHRPSFSGKNCSHLGSDHSLLWRCRVHKKMFRGGLPRWLSGKELACRCRSKFRSLVWEDPTCHRAAKPVHPNYWTWALKSGSRNYWRRPALEPMLGNERRLCNGKPQLESGPRLLQLEKGHVLQQRPIAAKNKFINNAQWNPWLLPTDTRSISALPPTVASTLKHPQTMLHTLEGAQGRGWGGVGRWQGARANLTENLWLRMEVDITSVWVSLPGKSRTRQHRGCLSVEVLSLEVKPKCISRSLGYCVLGATVILKGLDIHSSQWALLDPHVWAVVHILEETIIHMWLITITSDVFLY